MCREKRPVHRVRRVIRFPPKLAVDISWANSLLPRLPPKLLHRPHGSQAEQRQQHGNEGFRPGQFGKFRDPREEIHRHPCQQVKYDEVPE